MAGVVCYGAYVRFFEIAETEMFRSAGIGYQEIFDTYDVWLPRVSYKSEFSKPARLDERLRLHAGVKSVGRSSFVIEFAIDDWDGARVTGGEVTMVSVDRKTFKPVPLPDGFRATLNALTD